ncbi:WD40/YVTN/BNR-like repeat-containing protein [Salinicoccus halodurans]|uniref:Glycosyl hydrolase n=1 Tax=Salinicoccus halodurans TaxID=407035 RepID=A0A0F7D3U4_9STAP|nr:hypothetical protein [Salinicoccus halodurans]AKG73090.1 hypothetical protein AAT16_01980 [Salinicoccus halodurans]SFK85604.1 Uncharacterized protein SAMN05216235_2131 [Salinicoccus halodurans]
MKTLYFSAGNTLYEIQGEKESWTMTERSTPNVLLCIAADPDNPGRLYGGTFDDGLFISNDSGETWKQAGAGIAHDRLMSIAVSPTEMKNGYHIVWAGTEPSGLFRSEDGGETWTECPALLDLPSKATWSFPPRPETHHVRWIEPDAHDENRIFAGIELGGVMRSEDKGMSWEDRKPGSQHDCHTLKMHPKVSGRIYEAAGGGYAESTDAGSTWQTFNEGLEPYNYLVGIAVDSRNEDIIVASAAKSPRTAYKPSDAETILVRRENGGKWESVSEGLPDPEDSAVFSLAAHPDEPGVFHAVNNTGFYISEDSGQTWHRVPVEWPEHLKDKKIHWMTLV